ncbi:MAG: NADH-quinone oxidoreductase subunit C [Nitrososphaerota archaeon]|nr:NADH-quinone oxidoreductase subunit C [Aigarchaeota archaeon]MDW8076085.1 NADH-quinone oxidoreductase subunit C [Nitrososphaerota archaeon]
MSSDLEKTLVKLIDDLKKKFGDKILEVNLEPKKVVKVLVAPECVKEVAQHLKSEWKMDYIKGVTGVDLSRLPGNAREELEVIYHVGSLSSEVLKSVTLSLSTKVSISNPVISSLTSVWRGAEMHEREAYEMLGIRFEGHPDLRRLLLPEFWSDKPPLRKDYIPPGRER